MYTWNPTDLFLRGWHNFRETNPSKQGSHLDLFWGLAYFFITKKRHRVIEKPKSETTNTCYTAIPLAICFSKQPSGRLTLAASALPEMIGMPQKELLGDGGWTFRFRNPRSGATPLCSQWWCFSKNSWQNKKLWRLKVDGFWKTCSFEKSARNHGFTGIRGRDRRSCLSLMVLRSHTVLSFHPSEADPKIPTENPQKKPSIQSIFPKRNFPFFWRLPGMLKITCEVNIFFWGSCPWQRWWQDLGPWESGKLACQHPPNTFFFVFQGLCEFLYRRFGHTQMHIYIYIYIL